MKYRILIALLGLSLNAAADQNKLDLQGCDLQGQRNVVGDIGGKITDSRQAHILARANVLSADISTTQKAKQITEAEAEHMFNHIETIRRLTDHFVAQQGFLSAAEKASFDREFDDIAEKLCR